MALSKLRDAYVIRWGEGLWGVYVVSDDGRKHSYVVGTRRQAERELLSVLKKEADEMRRSNA
jgi:hypothetical protein